jgi:hypothetical protein
VTVVQIAAPQPVVDAANTAEFLRQALLRISEDEIAATINLLERKREMLATALAASSLARPDAASLRLILGRVFATKRRAADIVAAVGDPELAEAIRALVHGGDPVETRFDAFETALATLEPPIRRELAGECLHYADPSSGWLWSRWLWDPDARTGALPLVMDSGYDFAAATGGGAYLRVGAATASVIAAGTEVGFRRLQASPFAADVYLAAIYGVYLYTMTRLRMTQEFNRVVPALPDLMQRLHGVFGLGA